MRSTLTKTLISRGCELDVVEGMSVETTGSVLTVFEDCATDTGDAFGISMSASPVGF